jgi:hypothetical protein
VVAKKWLILDGCGVTYTPIHSPLDRWHSRGLPLCCSLIMPTHRSYFLSPSNKTHKTKSNYNKNFLCDHWSQL